MIYRTAQEAVLNALRTGKIPPELAKLVDPATGLVGGEISPGSMREFDPYTGQVHYQYALPVDMSGINPGLKTVSPEAGPVPPNMMPVGPSQQAAFSGDERDWAASRQAGQPGLTWGAQPMGGSVTALAQPAGAVYGSRNNPVQMDPMLQLRQGPNMSQLPTTRPGSGAPGGLPAGVTQNPAAPFGPGGVNPATLTPGYNTYQNQPAPANTPAPAGGVTPEQLTLISNFLQGMNNGTGVAAPPMPTGVGQALAGNQFQSQIPTLFGRPRPEGPGFGNRR